MVTHNRRPSAQHMCTFILVTPLSRRSTVRAATLSKSPDTLIVFP